jgi:integrase/recombinase XerD
MNLKELFERYILEKQYITGLSACTINNYRRGFDAFCKHGQTNTVTRESLDNFVITCRKASMTPRTLNSYIVNLNVFMGWLFQNGHITEALRMKKVKQEKKIQRRFSETELKRLMSFRPTNFYEYRLRALVYILIDTGIRIDEALTLTRDRVDFDNLLIKVIGKGKKERVVPISPELRKVLFKFLKDHEFSLVFPSRTGNKQDYSNAWQDLRDLCKRLGINHAGFHSFRRTFAKQYVKNGGNLFYLQACLGHSNIQTTKTYVDVEIEDLQITHQKTSLLAKLK